MKRTLAAVVLLTGFLIPAVRGESPKPAKVRPLQKQQLIDYGPYVTATIGSQRVEEGITNKAVAIKLSGGAGGVLFDTDTLRLSAGWVGGFVDFTKDWTGVRDSRSVKLVGVQTVGTKPGPGWANPSGGADAWKDPRENGFGPIPRPWAKYHGLYLHGDRVVLSYTVGECEVLESPGLEEAGGLKLIAREIELGKSDHTLRLLLCERDGTAGAVDAAVASLDLKTAAADALTRIGLAGQARGAKLIAEAASSRVLLEIPAQATPGRFKLLFWSGSAADPGAAQFAAAVSAAAPASDLASLTHGGPPRWNQTLTTAGVLNVSGGKDEPYVVDTLTLPDDNPYHAWMRPGGFDFFTSDPTRAAVCNWSGDVWIVSGIDAGLKELKWRRIATGLFQPLGLKIVKDQIYVLGRDQLTRLHDLNGDGETDFYENFNNDVQVTSSFHEFAFDLCTDSAGYFYFSKAGPVKNGGHGFDQIAAHHGSVLRVSPGGESLEVYATGFRAPNGICVGPDGQVTTGDNEGTWVPMCRLNWVKPGGFYGVVDTAHRAEKPTTYDGPLCWMPKEVDNSSGCQAWVTSDKWGPLSGRLLHLSYGTCSLFLVLKEEVNGQVQGGVVRFPLSFDSGIMRARFNPGDGQLYVAGLKGWQTKASKDGCLQRVRYTGKPVRLPTELNVTKDGLRLGFLLPLDAKEAGDAGNYAAERWNYLWSDAYGSKHYSVANPMKEGHDAMDVKSARVSADGKQVFLEVPDLKAVMQMHTTIGVKAADGTPMSFNIYHTIHELGAGETGK